MRRHHPHARPTSGFVVALALAALVLASCSHETVATARPRVVGTPALSISVPLSEIGCTLNDACVAVGTTGASTDPDAVAEFSTPQGRWLNLVLPTGPSPLIDALACSGSTCLLGGSEPGHDLLWLYQVSGESVTPAVVPAGGIGVDALTCDLEDCALVDTGARGAPPRFAESDDGGQSWGTPEPLAFATGDAVTTLACGDVEDCALGVMTASRTFELYVTRDAGATWRLESTPSDWTTLTSLSCTHRRCVALARVDTTSSLVRSSTFTRTWRSTTLSAHASSLACTPTATCLVAGARAGSPWLALVRDRAVTDVRLRYVPTPLIATACGSKVCAALGVTTLLDLTSLASP